MSSKMLDTDRLDWLEANPETGEPIIVYHPPSDHITWKISSGEEFDSLRDAIDNAMTNAQKPTPWRGFSTVCGEPDDH